MTIEILQTGPLLASCEAALAARYTVHKLHEQGDRDAWLRENGARIRAHAGSGVQAELMDKLGENTVGLLDGITIKAPVVAASPDVTITETMVGQVLKGRKSHRRFSIKEQA